MPTLSDLDSPYDQTRVIPASGHFSRAVRRHALPLTSGFKAKARIVLALSALFEIASRVAGCAQAPAKSAASPAAPVADCRALGADFASAEEARRTAQEKESTAWKAVLPVAVVARHAKGKAEGAQAEQRLVALKTQYGRQGCQSHVG